MTRICMLAYTDYSIDARVRREAEALTARANTVDVISLAESGHATPYRTGEVTVYPIRVGRYKGDRARCYATSYLVFFLRAFVRVTRLHARHRYDVIHVHTMPDFLIFAAIIPKLLGAKLVLDVHDLMPELYVAKFGGNGSQALVRLLKQLERSSIAFADRAIAVHEPHRNALVAHGSKPNRLDVLMNLPDARIFDPRQGRRRHTDGVFRLLYHGTVARRHGLDVALRAIAMTRPHVPRIDFTIIGWGEDLHRIRKLAEDLRLGQSVRFIDPMPVEALPPYLREADLGVVPVVLDAFTRYMLPSKLLEYVMLGIPVVVSRLQAVEAYFDDTMVRYFTPGDHRELAGHICDLARATSTRHTLAANAARFTALHAWETEKTRYFALIDTLTGSRHQPSEAP